MTSQVGSASVLFKPTTVGSEGDGHQPEANPFRGDQKNSSQDAESAESSETLVSADRAPDKKPTSLTSRFQSFSRLVLRQLLAELPPRHLSFQLAAVTLRDELASDGAEPVILTSVAETRLDLHHTNESLATAIATAFEGRALVLRLVTPEGDYDIDTTANNPGAHCRTTGIAAVDELSLPLSAELTKWDEERWSGLFEGLREIYAAIIVEHPSLRLSLPLPALHRAASRRFILAEEGRSRLVDVETLTDLYRGHGGREPELILTSADSLVDALARFAYAEVR